MLKTKLLELNASDDRGIDVVRNQIKEFASTGSIFFSGAGGKETATAATPAVSYKLIVLDEADHMSHDAQAALRRVIERFTKNVRFAILCNHVNKIIPAIQSRCTRFRFGPVKKAVMLPRLAMICESEHCPATEEGLSAAFRLSGGDMRRCLNMLHATALAHGTITEDNVYLSTGNPTPSEIRGMLEVMLSQDFSSAWTALHTAVTAKSLAITDIVRELLPLVMRLELPQDCKTFLVMKLADVEYVVASGTQETTALAAALGAVQVVKEAIALKQPVLKLASC